MKRFLFLFATLSSLLSLIATASVFSDVSEADWFYNDVKAVYDLELINGKGSATTFKPNDNMTYAEAIKLAACMHQRYTEGKVTLTNSNPWYQSYADYCLEKGIIENEYPYDEVVTRAGYMKIFSKALPDEALKEINSVSLGAIPDVSNKTKGYEGILVPCRGLDVDRDIASCVRMNRDMKKVAEVAAETGYIQPEDVARLLKFRDNPSDESWIGGKA